MITLIKKSDNDLLNPDAFFKDVMDNKYKVIAKGFGDDPDRSFFSICKDNSYWIVYIYLNVFERYKHKEYNDVFVFQVGGYHTKQAAIDAIDSGELEKELKHQYIYSNIIYNTFIEMHLLDKVENKEPSLEEILCLPVFLKGPGICGY